ncbi:MAG: alpha/beta hydrolase [Chloroflexota bacterium]|nr:alpha/beta hydrolase [Chloroflexota bacterium]
MPQVYVGDANLYYDEFGVGDPLLIVHGMLDTGRSHARLALTLSSHYHVIAPDLRGYGRSEPRPRRFGADFYARDAADLAGLLEQLHFTAVRVLGFGDGAEAALLLALAAPDRIRAVIAVDVSGAFTPALLEVLPTLGNWAAPDSRDGLVMRAEAYRDYGSAGTVAIWAGWKAAVRAIVAAGGDISLSQAGRIACPVFILNGATDPLNPVAQSETLAAAIPQADLQLVPDMEQLMYHTTLLTDLVTQWFATH